MQRSKRAYGAFRQLVEKSTLYYNFKKMYIYNSDFEIYRAYTKYFIKYMSVSTFLFSQKMVINFAGLHFIVSSIKIIFTITNKMSRKLFTKIHAFLKENHQYQPICS